MLEETDLYVIDLGDPRWKRNNDKENHSKSCGQGCVGGEGWVCPGQREALCEGI